MQHVCGILSLTPYHFSLQPHIYQAFKGFLFNSLCIIQLATRLRYSFPYFSPKMQHCLRYLSPISNL